VIKEPNQLYSKPISSMEDLAGESDKLAEILSAIESGACDRPVWNWGLTN
jgi:hypothetical protein